MFLGGSPPPGRWGEGRRRGTHSGDAAVFTAKMWGIIPIHWRSIGDALFFHPPGFHHAMTVDRNPRSHLVFTSRLLHAASVSMPSQFTYREFILTVPWVQWDATAAKRFPNYRGPFSVRFAAQSLQVHWLPTHSSSTSS